MTDSQTLIRLMSWLSPSFPTGAFSYSHGLEFAAVDLQGDDDLFDWIGSLLENGGVWNDVVLLAEAWRSENGCEELAGFGLAIAGSKERHLETLQQGKAFLTAAKPWMPFEFRSQNWPLPVAVGHVAAQNKLALEPTLAAFLHAFVSNQIQVALRLMPLGQNKGVTLLQRLETRIMETAKRAANSSLDDLGSAAMLAEIAAMKHETQHSRIFRT